MTKRYDESKWSADFRHLRKQDEQSAPDFHHLIEAASKTRASMLLDRPVVYALGGAAMLALIILVISSQDPMAPSIPGAVSSLNETEFKLNLAYEMPTDFLLEPLWFPLESTTPHFDLSIPTYEYREE